MENKFKREYYLRSSDFDKYNNILFSSVLDLFQDVAGAHAEEMGIGYHDTLSKGLFWVIVKNRFDILKNPELFSKVIVETWPLDTKRLISQREYLVRSESGEILIKGSSNWVVIDTSTRSFKDVKQIMPNIEYLKDRNYDSQPDKLEDVSENDATKISINKAVYSDLDHNGHMNNIKYMNHLECLCEPKEKFNHVSVYIEYHREIMENEEYKLLVKENDDGYIFKGVSFENDKKYTGYVKF